MDRPRRAAFVLALVGGLMTLLLQVPRYGPAAVALGGTGPGMSELLLLVLSPAVGIASGVALLLAARPLRDGHGASRRAWAIGALVAGGLGAIFSSGIGGGLGIAAGVVALMTEVDGAKRDDGASRTQV